MTDDSTRQAIISTLTKGLERLSASFPWLAGHVVHESGTYKIKKWKATPLLVVKDLSNDTSMASLDTLRQANFPYSMLSEDTLSARKTFPMDPKEQALERLVFAVQATFIEGGLILTFIGQHQVFDMTAQGEAMRLFSKACRDEAFTEEEIRIGNLSRNHVDLLLEDPYVPGPELDYQIVNPGDRIADFTHVGGQDSTTSPGSPRSAWCYFGFSSTSLQTLKSRAMHSMPADATSSYISTDDALTAFFWQSITRIRSPPRSTSPSTSSSSSDSDAEVEKPVTLVRAVNVRRYLSLPSTYPGMAINVAYQTLSPTTLSLGTIASTLRTAIDPQTTNMEYATKSLITYISQSTKNVVSFVAKVDLTRDLMVTSWTKVPVYDLDFGMQLGGPEVVRTPRSLFGESVVYYLPKGKDGSIVVGACLRVEHVEALRADREFSKYCTYVG